MGFKALCLGLLCVLFASHIYIPTSGNMEEHWEVTALDIITKTCTFMAKCFENIGIMRYEEFISMMFRLDYTHPLSDENLTMTDTKFNDIPVHLYLPKRKSEIPR